MPVNKPRRARTNVFFFILFFWCCCASCQPLDKKMVQESASAQKAPLGDASDTACAYFHFLWGRNAELRQDFEEALAAYRNVAICDGGASYPQSKIPILLLKLDRIDEAVAWLHQYLLTNPANVDMRMLYAKILLMRGDTDVAVRQYRRILANHPDDTTIALALAEIYQANNHSNEAYKIITQVLERDEQSYQAHILMARFLREEGNVDDAKAHYEQAIELNWSADIVAEQAELLLAANDEKKAEALLRDALSQEENCEKAYDGLIRLLLKQKRYDEALQELQGKRQITERQGEVDMEIAQIYFSQKNYAQARNVLSQLLTKEHGYTNEARLFLAHLFALEKNYNEALKQVRLIDNKAKEYPAALELRAEFAINLNRVDDLIFVLERNIESPLTRQRVMYPLLANLHALQGRMLMSCKVLEQGQAIYSDDDDLLYEYGLALEKAGEHGRAMEEMARLLERNPRHAGALNFIAYSWASQGERLNEALEYLRRAISIKPENGEIHDSLGWTLYRLGKIDEAIQELKKADKLSKNDPNILEHLAEAYLAGGKKDLALAIYKRLLRSYEELNDKKARQRVLKQIYLYEPPPGQPVR